MTRRRPRAVLARAEGEVRPAVAHKHRVLALGMVLDESGRHARERRERLVRVRVWVGVRVS